jgi:hypothetical protein
MEKAAKLSMPELLAMAAPFIVENTWGRSLRRPSSGWHADLAVPNGPDQKSAEYKAAAAKIRAENTARRMLEIAKRQQKGRLWAPPAPAPAEKP